MDRDSVTKPDSPQFRQKVAQWLHKCKQRAAKRGTEFKLRAEDIVIPEYCPILGIRLQLNNNVGNNDSSPSLDRIDNSNGYIPSNVIVVSMRANRIKNDATIAELGDIYSFYRRLEQNKYLKHKYTLG